MADSDKISYWQSLEKRTKEFAIRLIRFISEQKKCKEMDVIGYQLIKSGTSVGANYREANRAESRKDFIHKIALVVKEASETHYWIELLDELEIGDNDERSWLLKESDEFLALFNTSYRSAKSKELQGVSEESAPYF